MVLTPTRTVVAQKTFRSIILTALRRNDLLRVAAPDVAGRLATGGKAVLTQQQ